MKDKVILVEMLFEKVEQYIKTSFELYKLKAIDKGTDVFTSVVSRIVIFAIIALIFFLITVGLALYLGELLGKPHLGFFALGGIYTVITIILLIFRKPLLDDSLNNFMVKEIFKEKKR